MTDSPLRTVESPRDARDLVTRRIAAQARRFPDVDIAPLFTDELDERDARFAGALYTEVMRRWLTLEYLINHRLNRPMREVEARMQAVLLTGAAQIFFFDHVPAHAAVDEAVGWARQNIRAGAAGVVNAVLRRLTELTGPTVGVCEGNQDRSAIPLSDGRYRILKEGILPADRHGRWAAATGHPRSLVDRWAHRMSPSDVERLLLHDLVHPPILIHGLCSKALEGSEDLRPHSATGFSVFTGTHAALRTLLTANPGSIVQDPSAYAAITATEGIDLKGRLIVDYCAGQGTKTAALARMHPEARIIATDADARRLSILHERFKGSEQVQVRSTDSLLEHAGKADLLILDVPCSNSGVLPRRVEARYRIDDAHLKSLVGLQRQIIADSMRLRSPNGRILYSTCSLESLENQEQTDWVCRWHRMRVISQRLLTPRGLPGEDAAGYADGGFHALIG